MKCAKSIYVNCKAFAVFSLLKQYLWIANGLVVIFLLKTHKTLYQVFINVCLFLELIFHLVTSAAKIYCNDLIQIDKLYI